MTAKEWYHESARAIIALAMLLQSRLLVTEGFAHAFPTRDTGDDELRSLFSGGPVVQVKQVHGGRVVEADAALGAEADAIVARWAGQALAVGVRVADCVPVLLASLRTGDVAAVHAGWRGVVAKVVPAALAALGTGPIVAAIGPCIGICCFEVGADVAAQLVAACEDLPATPRRAFPGARDKVHIDLRASVRSQLVAAGVSPAHIDDVVGCTKHEAARFHSYRRDGAGSGRMLAAIATRR